MTNQEGYVGPLSRTDRDTAGLALSRCGSPRIRVFTSYVERASVIVTTRDAGAPFVACGTVRDNLSGDPIAITALTGQSGWRSSLLTGATRIAPGGVRAIRDGPAASP